AISSVQPLLNLWPTPASGAQDFNGISQVFSSTLQTVREDFGTSRLDRIFSQKDSRREVPKSSRTVCSGLLNTCEIPLKSCEDFGTSRLDRIFSQKDSLAAIYTADD